jgi:hypothetical protein
MRSIFIFALAIAFVKFVRLLFFAALIANAVSVQAQLINLDKGHRILIDRGLQIQGQAFYRPEDLGVSSYSFDPQPFLDANFTTINWQWAIRHAIAPGDFPWGRWTGSDEADLTPAELPYKSSMVTLLSGEESNLNDPAVRMRWQNWFAAARPNFPNTILYTKQLAFDATPENLLTYMSHSQPDMLFMNSYRWKVGNIEGTWHLFSDMQRYRKFALLGNDGSGARPIPYGLQTQTFQGEGLYRVPSESELRMHHFGAWAFGYKVTSAFTYNYGTSALFSPGYHTANPTPTYYQLQEINRQGQNLGPALVRLLSKDVLWLGGKHLDGSGNEVWNPIPIDMKAYPFSGSGYPADGFSTATKDPWIRGVQSIANLGTTNNGRKGDFLLSWFQVLDESLDGLAHSGEWYFMVTNALVDPTGSAAETRQTIQINYAANVPAQVQRLNRDTGQIELIDLEEIPGTGGRRKLVLALDGGTADLFKFNTGAPFVGIELPGDYNHDGTVDAADYVAWRKGIPPSSPAAHYDQWRMNFGRSNFSGAGGTSIEPDTQVPEPGGYLLAVLALFLSPKRRKARRDIRKGMHL